MARGETPTQRLDRNYAELLQEIRVAQTGVQLLLAFLLSLAFTPRFASLGEFDRSAFVASLVLGAAATALLIAPAPVHRLVFQHRLKRQLVHLTSGLALSGLVLLMLSLSSALMLILDVVLGQEWAGMLTAGIVSWFSLWWYIVPLWLRWCRGQSPRVRKRPVHAGRPHPDGTRPEISPGPRPRDAGPVPRPRSHDDRRPGNRSA
ncbi:DUF6328 family protein [Kutzneria sp. NPDC052558]|uniref:DUF6328 family protein n=1 Tax=Kutzneria sp. NPDC052558 TaxID=3364121 RepID=UPI0037C64426